MFTADDSFPGEKRHKEAFKAPRICFYALPELPFKWGFLDSQSFETIFYNDKMVWVHSLRSLVSYRAKHSKRNPIYIYIYISTRAHELFPIRDGVLVWFVMTFGTHLMHMLFLDSSPLMEQRDHYSLPHLDMAHGTWDGCNVVWWRGTLWLKNTVFRCRHKGWRGSNCGHWEDASVRCDSTWRKTYF